MGRWQCPLEDLGLMARASFWQGKQVLLTGHTGFKGAWAALWLDAMGARVTGFARPPNTRPNLHDMLGETAITSILGDLRDLGAVEAAVEQAAPDIVLHLAAQPLVRQSYHDPVETFATNMLGTVHLLDVLRRQQKPMATLIVTTDKVYENDESGRAFAEGDRLGGHDPYAASKAAAEIAVASYRRSFFAAASRPLVTARGGNVIGGGDFSADRLVPDIIRAAQSGQKLELRNPAATRPWQHVLDCLDGYFTYAEALAAHATLPNSMNIGPHDPADTMTVEAVTVAMCRAMGMAGDWDLDTADQPHEMAALALDPTQARETLGWQGRLASADAIRLTADWYGAWANRADMKRFTLDQITAYQKASDSGQETPR